MTTFKHKLNKQKLLYSSQISITLLVLFSLLQPGYVKAQQSNSIQTIDLNISTKDIARVEFGYHHSSFESYHVEYDLEVKNGVLTNGRTNMSLSRLTPLLKNLKGMYPGTRPLYWNAWSDDYPHAWVYLHLKDGGIVSISSDSQFDGMFPWNVSVWASEKSIIPNGSYIQLDQAFFDGMEALWKGVGEDGFPRKRGDDLTWVFGDSTPETLNFSNEDNSDTVSISGKGPASLSLFLPLLEQNIEIKSLLENGYTVYDALLSLEVQTQTLNPVQYSGTLALATPDEKDVVIGLVTLPLETGKPVTTTLKASESMLLVTQRKMSKFLNESERMLSHLTFLLDTRQETRIPEFNCQENSDVALNGQIIQGIWNPVQPMRITFYPLTNGLWSVDFGLRREDPNWNDSTVQNILKAWFPESISTLPIQNIQEFHSNWRVAFQRDVTLRMPELLNRLKFDLPEQTVIHEQNPEKAGDYGFLSLDGRVVISENGVAPIVVYCGVTFPDWYGPAYDVASVVSPNEQTPRQNISIGKNGDWLSLKGSLPYEEYRTNWTSIAFTQPGFLHVLWTDDREGVYYADGLIDGTGWIEPQRLGDDAYWLTTRAWPDGEIHLFWDAGLTTKGSIHVWRPVGGDWQKAEHWPIAYFSEVIRGTNSVLHIGSIESDGLDGEFMHRTWSPEKGLSAPENISRQVGSDGTGILRLDSNGRLHAVWTHILEEKSPPDPITGETPDISGIFYAHQLPDGRWSKPEHVGNLAAYAHAISMELDAQNNPLIIWQADGALLSRIKKNNNWDDSIKLAEVTPPETPAEFGPERWVQPTAEIQTGVNSQGQIIVGWIIPEAGLKMAFWSDPAWTDLIDIVSSGKNVYLEPIYLQMVVDNYDKVHFVFFKNNVVNYGLYDNGNVKTNPLSMRYDLYGLPEASLLVDTTGSIAVLGLPRSPGFDTKISPEGIPPTPTLIPTPIPTSTRIPTFMPESTLIPSQTSSNNSFTSLFIEGGILTILIVIWIIRTRYKKSTQ